jgi:hypothetical protein
MVYAATRRRPIGPEPTVERKIYFYEIDAGTKNDEPADFDPAPILDHLNSQPFTLDGRYLDAGDGNVTFVLPKSTSYPQKLVYVLSRRTNLPELERAGAMSPLPIPTDGGLGEKIHCVFFGRYAAADFNFYGPRATTISTYFALKAKGVGRRIKLGHLVRGEAVEDLRKLDGLTVAQFKFRESAMRLVERADASLAEAFRATLAVTGADELELILRMKRGKSGITRYLSGDVFKGIRNLAKYSETYDEFDRLIATGVSKETAQRAEVDVLDDQLIVKRKMIKIHKRGRAVQSESAFEEIETAFQEVLPRLRSVGVLQ